MPIDQAIAEIWQFFDFFQNGGLLPCWIRYTHVWTTHEEHLPFFVTLQNLVGFGAVVSNEFQKSTSFNFTR